MNYFEDHIGDYAAATAHLSWDEDMAYTRLIRAYYHAEKPIPEGQGYRLARATTPAQRRAVDTVLSEFFTLEADGWHQKRCDAEIAKFRDKEPDREAKRDNERERQRRTRERRKQIFDALRDVGVIPAFDAPMSQLNALLSQHNITAVSQPVTRDVTQPVTRDVTQPVTRDVTQPVTRDDTATQSPDPDTRHQSLSVTETAPAFAECGAALKRAGINLAIVNTADPVYRALVGQGMTPEELEPVAREAVAKRIAKPLPWICTVVQDRRARAAAITLAPAAKEAKPWDNAL